MGTVVFLYVEQNISDDAVKKQKGWYDTFPTPSPSGKEPMVYVNIKSLPPKSGEFDFQLSSMSTKTKHFTLTRYVCENQIPHELYSEILGTWTDTLGLGVSTHPQSMLLLGFATFHPTLLFQDACPHQEHCAKEFSAGKPKEVAPIFVSSAEQTTKMSQKNHGYTKTRPSTWVRLVG